MNGKNTIYLVLIVTGLIISCSGPSKKSKETGNDWALGPFERIDSVNPVLQPSKDFTFTDPIIQQPLLWEEKDVFNPAAVVRDNKVYLLYRAEDKIGVFKGTSRIGLALSDDGLHFTKQLMKRLEIKGVDINPITLHIGLGSFRPVDVEDLTKHKMDSENYRIEQPTTEVVNKALDNKKRVCAIGTTTMRTLESSVSAGGRLKANEGWTDKFIFPPFEFKICNALLTNFHNPESTLLMMACAFGGYDLIMEAYKVAIKHKYKFFAYGDCMLII